MRRKPKTLPPIHPNVGISKAYQRKLDALIREMGLDLKRSIDASYAENPPEIAQDAAEDLIAEMRTLRRKWLSRFDTLSHELAVHFSTAIAERTDATLRASLKKAGFTVKFQITPAQRDLINSAVGQNVALIKSIPEQHLTQVEGLVLRSVQEGRALHIVAQGLQKELGVTRKRAAFIALNQNNMATAALARNRQMELGLKAIWMHSHADKKPRRSHLANNGKEYDPATGWFDPDEKVFCWPGSLIGCTCRSKTKVPGFD